MWIDIILYFYVAASLVAGEWQPQDYGQNQLRPPLPVMPLDTTPVLSPVLSGQPASIPQAKPCRRRNIGDSGIIYTDSGWVPLPFGQQPISQQTSQPVNQPFQPQLKPQSLTENRDPTIDDRKPKAEQMVREMEYPDKTFELIKKNPNPNQNSETQNREEYENKITTPDQKLNNIFLDKVKPDQDSKPSMLDKRDHNDNSQEKTLECGKNGEVENTEQRSGNPETKDVLSKSEERNEAYEQAEKVFTKCIHESRRSMSDTESDLRSFEDKSQPSTNELDKMDSGITSKSAQKYNTQLTKPLTTSGINQNVGKEYLQNPAKNAGAWHSGRQVSLLENGKVCYACSSYYDPSCWKTNATTTVKYCNRDNNACLTKMYKIDGISILIRDCGHTCNEDEAYNIGQKMTSCSMCHNDMCNSAYAVHGLHALLVTFIICTLKFALQ